MGRGLHFLIDMVPNGTAALFTADTYIGYFIAMLLGFGLCFELPLFLVMLNQVGILTHERFKKWRRVMIFVVFVFAGIASPSPDPITMLMLGGGCRPWWKGPRSSCSCMTGARPDCTPTRTKAWPTTSCPRSTSTRQTPAAGSTDGSAEGNHLIWTS